MVHASGIGRVSAELKNTSNKFKTLNQKIGSNAEVNVIRLLQTRCWSLSFRGFRTRIAEIDLIFEKEINGETHVLLIEVKSLNNSWRAFERIHKNQLLKLQKNCISFSMKFNKIKFKAYVVWVDNDNKITFVEV